MMPSGKLCVWTEAEDAALQGLRLQTQLLYLRALRWYMDVATGIVGLQRGISYRSLAECLYVEPRPGRRDSGMPTEKAVRKMIDELMAAGLVERIGGDQVLVFRLPLAGKSARPKNKGHQEGRVSVSGLDGQKSVDKHEVTDVINSSEGQGVDALMGHTSEVNVNPFFVVAASANVKGSRPVDNSALPLLLPVGKIVQLVASWEGRRGCVSPLSAGDPLVASWVDRGLTAENLDAAYRRAVAMRVRTKSRQPINAGLLDAILLDILNGKPVFNGADGGRPKEWFETEAGLLAMAERVGVVRLDGESLPHFRGRIGAEIAEQRKQRRRK